MSPNIFYVNKVDKSNIKIDIDLLRKQRDWFVEKENNAQIYLDYTTLNKEGKKATEKQLEIIQGTINLMDTLLDLGEGYEMETKCPNCQQKAMTKDGCLTCGYTKNEHIMKIIGDYDIIVDDPKKHIPWAMLCSTSDAYLFMQELKKEKPEINWKMMKLDEWAKQYNR